MAALILAVAAMVAAMVAPVEAAPARRAYSPGEAAAVLGIGRTTVYQLVSEGRLRVVKIGVRTLIPATEIDRLLNDGNSN